MEEQLELLREIRNKLTEKKGDFFICNIYAEIRNIQPGGKRWMKRKKLFEKEIPLFTPENASEFNTYSHVDLSEESAWWYGDNLDDRLAFVDWMIETIQLKEDKFILNSF